MTGELSGARGWVDQDAQERVRPYVLTGDLASPRHDLRLDTMLTAAERTGGGGTSGERGARGLQPEAAHLVRLCREGDRSVAELAALIGYPVLVTKIIISELLDRCALVIPLPAVPTAAAAAVLGAPGGGFYEPAGDRERTQVLSALLVGLENLDAAVA